MTTWPTEAPHPLTVEYMVFAMSDDKILALGNGREFTEDEAAERFERKHGTNPEWLIAWRRHLWVGPIGEGESDE